MKELRAEKIIGYTIPEKLASRLQKDKLIKRHKQTKKIVLTFTGPVS